MCSEKAILEVPHSSEHGRMRQYGLGYRGDIRFPLSGLNADARAMFFREFQKLREAKRILRMCQGCLGLQVNCQNKIIPPHMSKKFVRFLFESTTKFSNLIFYKENVTKIDLYLS